MNSSTSSSFGRCGMRQRSNDAPVCWAASCASLVNLRANVWPQTLQEKGFRGAWVAKCICKALCNPKFFSQMSAKEKNGYTCKCHLKMSNWRSYRLEPLSQQQKLFSWLWSLRYSIFKIVLRHNSFMPCGYNLPIAEIFLQILRGNRILNFQNSYEY